MPACQFPSCTNDSRTDDVELGSIWIAFSALGAAGSGSNLLRVCGPCRSALHESLTDADGRLITTGPQP